MFRYILTTLCSLAFAISAQANLLTNGSFESDLIPANTYQTYPTPTAWSWAGTAGIIVNGNGGISGWPSPEDGQQYVDIGNYNAFSLYQNFTVTTGGLYQITWHDSAGVTTPSPYSIDVFNSLSTTVGNANFDASHGGTWIGRTLSLNLVPDTYRLAFTAQGIPHHQDTLLDNINVASAPAQTPEPAIFSLFCLGLAGFGLFRKSSKA